MPNIATIYIVTNTVNGKQYVGQTWRCVEERWRQHRRSRWSPIGGAIQKYGEQNFRIEPIVSVLTQDNADAIEIAMILRFNTRAPNGYNLQQGGRGGRPHLGTCLKISISNKGRTVWNKGLRGAQTAWNKGKSPTTETRAKQSAAMKGKTAWNKGRPHSLITREKLSAAQKGKPSPYKGKSPSLETRVKQSAAKKGKTLTAEHRAKIGIKSKGRKHSLESRQKIAESWRRRLLQANKRGAT